MRTTERFLILALSAAGAACGARPLVGQRDASLLYGRWTPGGITTYEARLDRPLGSWLRHGPTLHVLLEDRDAGRGFYGVGYEVASPRGSSGVAMYGLLGAALGMISDTGGQGLGALWSAGVGVEWRPLRFLGLNLEERYRVTDRGPRGFWRPGAPHKGWGTLLGLSFTLETAGRRRPQAVSSGGGVPAPSASRGDGGGRPADPPLMIVGRAGDVVRTALAVLGSPYQWGGTAENGFDCSGLVQYSYARHGIRLPRTSRAQAQSGRPVAPVFDSLQAGDILTFAARPGGGVTHVGMYVGDGKFIHSSSTGVKLSRLSSADPEAAYWIPRWMGVRRVLP
ncbi:MAG TPA: NlpC/P60 family protein [Gemmatimonadales bacterium]|nr:NlpC/P60 family protein [Gemmatimonadales bacterium]